MWCRLGQHRRLTSIVSTARSKAEEQLLTADLFLPSIAVLDGHNNSLAITSGPFDGEDLALALVLPVTINKRDGVLLWCPAVGNTGGRTGEKSQKGCGYNSALHFRFVVYFQLFLEKERSDFGSESEKVIK